MLIRAVKAEIPDKDMHASAHPTPRVPHVLEFLSHPATLLWAGIVPLALLLRLSALSGRRLWIDEFYSIAMARLDHATLFRMFAHAELNMALYYTMLNVWLRIGHSEVFIRLLSLIPAVATIPLLYALGCRLFDRWAALIACFFLAANAFHVWYSLEARSYNLFAFLATLSSYYFVEGIYFPTPAVWSLYAVSTALAAYSHFFGILILPAHLLSLLFLRKKPLPWTPLLVSSACIVLAQLPILAVIRASSGAQIGWVPRLDFQTLMDFALELTGSGRRWLLALQAAFVLLALLVVLRKRAAALRWQTGSWGVSFALAWLVGPIGFAILYSLHRPIFFPRFLIFCWPAFALLSGAGLSTLRPKPLLAATLALSGALSILAVPRYARQGPLKPAGLPDSYDANEYVLSHRAAGDGIVFAEYYGALPFRFFRDRKTPIDGPQILFPNPWTKAQLTPGYRVPEAAALRPLFPAYRRIWFVTPLPEGPDSDQIKSLLDSVYPVVSGREFRGVRVELYDRGDQTGTH